MGFPSGSSVKNPPARQKLQETWVQFPGSIRSPGGHGNPLQDSCLENPMVRGAWWATAHKVTKSWTQLQQLSARTPTYTELWLV